jgi:spermidine synthase
VDLGIAELAPDPYRPGGWLLRVDGVAQSYVDLADPTYLEFEYMRRMAWIVDAAAPPTAPLRTLHLGGGALTLPRYVAATRPGSAQVVVERDSALADLIQRELPLPADAGIEIRIGDARAAVDQGDPDGFDLVLADVYSAARMPHSVASAEYAAAVANLMRPDGVYAVNVADLPPLAFSKVQAATLRTAFADVCVIAEPGLLRGRRYGNVILAATGRPDGLPATRIARVSARDVFRSRLIHGDALDGFMAGADPVTDATADRIMEADYRKSRSPGVSLWEGDEPSQQQRPAG